MMNPRNRPATTTGSAGSSLRRPPPALRGAPGSRGSGAKAHVSLSLVFAHGDAAPVPSSSASIRRVSRCISSPSEEALSRQLDRDTAGERMSLRSRRSSAATLASRADFSPHPLSPGLPEEREHEHEHDHEDEGHTQHGEGSSRPLGTSSAGQPLSATLPSHPDPVQVRQPRTINPKSSAVWRRWNSPAPSFPRKGSKAPSLAGGGDDVSERGVRVGRGDHDDRGGDDHAPISAPIRSSIPASVSTRSTLSTHSHQTSSNMPQQDTSTQPPASHAEPQDQPHTPDGGATPREPSTPMLGPPKPEVVVQAPTPTRGWLSAIWGSSTPAPSSPKPETQLEVPVEAEADGESLSKVESRSSAITHQSTATNGTAASSGSKRRRVEMTIGPSWGPDSTPSATITDNAATPFHSAIQQTTDTSTRPDAEPTAADEAEDAGVAEDDDNQQDTAHEASKADVPAQPPQEGQPGWGPYLWSWVVPPPLPPVQPPDEAPSSGDPVATAEITTEPEAMQSPEESNAVQPTDATADQKPVCEPTTCEEHTSQAEPQDATPSEAIASGSKAAPPTQTTLASSSSSTAGWLSYLAFRATQKRITGSTITPDDARRSGETHREEVMDLESDPNFPDADKTPKPKAKDNIAAPRVSTDSKTSTESKPRASADRQRISTDGKRPSSLREDKRLSSVSDGKAGKTNDKPASITGAKPDAKATAKGDGKAVNGNVSLSSASNKHLTHKRSQNLAIASRRMSEASSVHSTGSGPPSPRVAQNRQNNPASDLAPPPQAPAKQPNFIIPSFETTFDRPPRSLLPQSTTSGVGAATGLAVRALGALGSYVYGGHPESPQETRGKKEGRDVGSDLPRRIGLASGTKDDGWRHVKRVVVVGVHGWFPTKMLTSVIGEPTGTSTKFATMMGDAVRKFFNDNGVSEEDIRLTMIPLEGEGTIESRVDRLYKQYLSNPAWINDLRRADAILFAAHSQGCIVTTHLISRMIAQGHIRTPLNKEAVARCEWAFGPIGIVPDENSKRGRRLAASLTGAEGGRQKVCMLAMCGVHLGPLYSISTSSVIGPYLQWFENAAARELFEFQDSTSPVSQAYQKALAMILENEVRVLLLSSLNDQVVPIYGASFASATHPLLLRALYVDGASYSASDFMTNLICFAFMLRNAGIDDQRLVEHLSEATAGSLTGVGHSTPYDELGCYSLAVQYLFHCGSPPTPLPALKIEPFAAREGRNDFELPWIMRAIVDSPEVKDIFPDELKELKDSIIAWRPQTKALKEIKKRLEPMAGRRHLSSLATSAAAERDKDKDSKDKDKDKVVRKESAASLNAAAAPTDKKKPRVTPSRLRTDW